MINVVLITVLCSLVFSIVLVIGVFIEVKKDEKRYGDISPRKRDINNKVNTHSNTDKVSGCHYEQLPCEVIDIIESIASRNNIPDKSKYSICSAMKYIGRAGLKDGESYIDDLRKAENYIHRAWSGAWIGNKKELTDKEIEDNC